MIKIEDISIAVIGLGYVGLPLACLLATRYPVTGYDISRNRIEELNDGRDKTGEVTPDGMREALANGIRFTSNCQDIKTCTFYIVTVPTPIDGNKNPDLSALKLASETVGGIISPGDIVVYESTVYPGVTENECVPVIERLSGLAFNRDFYAGYSPERVNPGDRTHTIDKIKKVTSGSTPEAAALINEVYGSVIGAGTHPAPSIRVAEASKVIENAQRDINIAFVNELSKILRLLDIDTHDVLEAASTKWNFLPFKPGLVGGHCIGVDPYYLAQCAESRGYHPEIILAGRRLNDGMGEYVASQVIRLMIRKGIDPVHSRVLVLGFTFKENCPDVRNSRVIDIVHSFQDYGLDVAIHDPCADPAAVREEYGLELLTGAPSGQFEAIILAVPHEWYRGFDIRGCMAEQSVVYDVKGFLERDDTDGRL